MCIINDTINNTINTINTINERNINERNINIRNNYLNNLIYNVPKKDLAQYGRIIFKYNTRRVK
jgi:hypothetical protein